MGRLRASGMVPVYHELTFHKASSIAQPFSEDERGVLEIMTRVMTTAVDLAVPLEVDFE